MTVPPAADPRQEPAHAEPPFSPGPVQELLRLVFRAARAHQLYLPNNPIYRGAIESLRAGFLPIWAETDELPLDITETEIRWFDVVVLGGAKTSDNLAWLFFKDGVREVRLLKGFDEHEVIKLLDVIQRSRKSSPDEDDLVTMLWETDFSLLTFRYVDVLAERGAEVLDGGELNEVSPSEVRAAAEAAVEELRTSGVVDVSAFDTTLYFLEEREIRYLQDEVKREYEQDLRANVTQILLDIFEAQADPEIRGETLGNVEELMMHLLTTGHFNGVAAVLREARIAIERASDVSTAQRERLDALTIRLSAPGPLSQLIQALDAAPVLPRQADLTELFDQLQPGALGTVFEWLSRIHNESLRPLLESAANRLAAANTNELVRLIQVPEQEVSNEAIRRAGALRAQAAVLALGRITTEPDAGRRLIAVQALAEIASPGALQALELSIEDTDREVRIAAVRALTGRGYRPVLSRLETVVRDRAIRAADLTEKMAFFEGYGALCGGGGVAYLDSLLNGRTIFGRREDPELRACAAIALGRVDTSAALAALQRASTERDIVVRNAISRALRGAVPR